ncbi:transposase family protein, partial [uncultured Streptococcus sp.]|uniref:transposase family protein n=1 Tax=uncultured Streptococcus sp. TaxID=83427 RepID=UPI0025F4C098
MSDLLSLPDIKTIEPPQENETDMMFKVEAVGPPERCPECGFDKLYKHSSRNQLIMDLPIRLKRVGLLGFEAQGWQTYAVGLVTWVISF